uniref:Uncharacterized protein n=1 Tax=Amphimedon queenslandica TaxID=400682 RepID=A0A1X7T0D0_AMPQE
MLERSVQSLYNSGLADSTKSSYTTAQNGICLFVLNLNLSPSSLTKRTLSFYGFPGKPGSSSKNICLLYVICKVWQVCKLLKLTLGLGYIMSLGV